MTSLPLFLKRTSCVDPDACNFTASATLVHWPRAAKCLDSILQSTALNHSPAQRTLGIHEPFLLHASTLSEIKTTARSFLSYQLQWFSMFWIFLPWPPFTFRAQCENTSFECEIASHWEIEKTVWIHLISLSPKVAGLSFDLRKPEKAWLKLSELP